MRHVAALALFALVASTTAQAEPFVAADVPTGFDFSFDWASLPTVGQTDVTFHTAIAVTPSEACVALADAGAGNSCFRGTFTTGNEGYGTYLAQAYFPNGCGFWTRVFGGDCEVRQRVTLTYTVFAHPYVNAEYTGVARAARVRWAWAFWQTSAITATYNEPFSGTMSGPDTGVWSEI